MVDLSKQQMSRNPVRPPRSFPLPLTLILFPWFFVRWIITWARIRVLQRPAAVNTQKRAAVESGSRSGAAATPQTRVLQRSAAVNLKKGAAMRSGSCTSRMDHAAVQNGASRSCSTEKRKGEERNKKAGAVESSGNNSGSVSRSKDKTIQNGAFTGHSAEKRAEKVAADGEKKKGAAVELSQNDSGSSYGSRFSILDSAAAQNIVSGAEKRKDKGSAEESSKHNPSEVSAKDAEGRRTYTVGESSRNSKGRSISVGEDLVQIIEKEKLSSRKRKRKPATPKLEDLEQPFYCAICMETKHPMESFTVQPCAHEYCIGCVRGYVAAKVEENVSCIGCPDPTCKDGILELETCRWMLPDSVFDRWSIVLWESTLGSKRFYCPFKDCSVLLVNEEGSFQDGVITNSECPHCCRMFCAQCKVPWHSDISCEEFQRLGKDERGRDDMLLRKLAAHKGWKRCPICRMYVEKIDGCRFVRCRCGSEFCYGCPSPQVSAQNHYCTRCDRCC